MWLRAKYLLAGMIQSLEEKSITSRITQDLPLPFHDKVLTKISLVIL